MLALLSESQRRKINMISEKHKDAKHFERSLNKSETMHINVLAKMDPEA